jgi:endoglucanase
MRKLILPLIILFCSCRKEMFPTSVSETSASNAVAANFITADDFRNSQFRGFNASLIETYSVLNGKNLPRVKSTGANHIRAWVHVQHDAKNRYYFSKSTALKTVDSMCGVAERNGLYVILTVEFLPRQGADDWWGNNIRKSKIQAFWRDSIAKRYKDRSVIAAYDLMNEPRRNKAIAASQGDAGTVEYIQFTRYIINAIRQVDKNHAVVVEVLENEMLRDLAEQLEPQFNTYLRWVSNVIYSPHGYNWQGITHQGINSTSRQVYPKEPPSSFTANYFPTQSYWNDPAVFQKKYNMPIWVGEFGCVNWAPLNLQGEWTSVRWMQDAIEYMESLGWSWSAHAWREWAGWDLEVPSSWYVTNATFTNAYPSKLPGSSARSDDAPMMLMLRRYLARNN